MIINEKDKNLIIFTDSFPFGKGEQFLETEVPYLAMRFREVTIIPNSICGPRRQIPNSIRVELSQAQKITNLQKTHRIYRMTRYVILAITSLIFYKELLSRPKSLIDFRALIRVIAYLAHAKRVHKWLLSYIEHSNMNLENTLFYTYWFSSTTMGITMAKKKYPKIKVVSRAHGSDLYEEVHVPPYIPFRKINLDQIDKIYAISDHGKNYIVNRYEIATDRVIVSRLGVDDPGFDAACSKDRTFRIVSCSFLVPVKRIKLLMEGISKLADQRPDLQIQWSHLGDGPLLRQLETEAKNLFSSSIMFRFYGRLPNSDIIKYYKEHPVDIFVNVSKSEGIPVSIMEAQSCAIPIIATAVGGTPEIVNDKNGILMESNPNPNSIAKALNKFTTGGNEAFEKRKCSKLNWYLKYNAKINYTNFCDDLLRL